MATASAARRTDALATPSNGAAEQIEFTAPYRAEIEVTGVAPFLFHAWNVESIAEKAGAAKGSKAKKTDNLESYVYRDGEGVLGIPGAYIAASVREAGKYMQDPRSPRKSCADLFRASIVPMTVLASTGQKDWDYVDRRRVVIQRSGVTRERPALREGWKVTFILLVTAPEYVSPTRLHEALIRAGQLIGLGDFRPSHGRFQVTRFEVLKD